MWRKNIQTKILRVHLNILRTHDQVSRQIDIFSVVSKKDKKNVSCKSLFYHRILSFFA
jgi:hypothetical protein